MKQIFRLTFFLVVVCPLFLGAQLQTGLSLPYLVREPSIKVDKPKIMILLHGYGSNEADLFALQSSLPANSMVISARAPIAMGDNGFQWFRMETVNGAMQGNREDIKSSAEKIKSFIKEITLKYQAEANQVYLCGFSQGAMMSYEVGLTAPQLLKGIAPLGGKIFDSLKANIKPSASLKALKIFIGHGDADNRVAYSYATEADSFLKKLGLSPVFHTYKGLGHSINQAELSDLVLWFNDK